MDKFFVVPPDMAITGIPMNLLLISAVQLSTHDTRTIEFMGEGITIEGHWKFTTPEEAYACYKKILMTFGVQC